MDEVAALDRASVTGAELGGAAIAVVELRNSGARVLPFRVETARRQAIAGDNLLGSTPAY